MKQEKLKKYKSLQRNYKIIHCALRQQKRTTDLHKAINNFLILNITQN